MASIELKGVSKRYSEALYGVRDVDLTIADGEFVIFLGPSGCGKSTMLRMIAGLESVSSGELRIGGVDMTRVAPRDRNVAVVFQSYALYPHMSVRANMGFGLKMRGSPLSEIEPKVAGAARLLGLEPYLDRKPVALSGGQRQRVALGRAIVREPDVFLFDEPLSNLDAQLRAEMRVELVKLHRRLGRTIVHVTHDQVEAMTMGDRICIMREGRLVQSGHPLDVYADPVDMFVARFLASPPMNLLPCRLLAEGERLVVDLAGGLRLRVPNRHRGSYGPLVGRRLMLGLRPEDIYETPDGRDLSQLDIDVTAVEALGPETIVVGCPASPDGGQAGERVEMSARLGRSASVRPGDRVALHADLTPMHLFDSETGAAFPRPSLRRAAA